VTDSTDIAVYLVDEIVNSSFESAQKLTAHFGSRTRKRSNNGQRSFHGWF